MRPAKMRSKMIYRAAYSARHLASPISKDLRKKYGIRSIRTIVGDSVRVTRGEYNGVEGKVSSISTTRNTVAIEGLKEEKIKGEKYDIQIHASNILVTGLNSEDKRRMTRIGGMHDSESGAGQAEKPVQETNVNQAETGLEIETESKEGQQTDETNKNLVDEEPAKEEQVRDEINKSEPVESKEGQQIDETNKNLVDEEPAKEEQVRDEINKSEPVESKEGQQIDETNKNLVDEEPAKEEQVRDTDIKSREKKDVDE